MVSAAFDFVRVFRLPVDFALLAAINSNAKATNWWNEELGAIPTRTGLARPRPAPPHHRALYHDVSRRLSSSATPLSPSRPRALPKIATTSGVPPATYAATHNAATHNAATTPLKARPLPRRAYVTLLARGRGSYVAPRFLERPIVPDYVRTAAPLVCSFRHVRSEYPLIVLAHNLSAAEVFITTGPARTTCPPSPVHWLCTLTHAHATRTCHMPHATRTCTCAMRCCTGRHAHTFSHLLTPSHTFSHLLTPSHTLLYRSTRSVPSEWPR